MKTLKIPFGPQHPALEEPLNFTFQVEEERVVDVKLRLGYVHRGIEKIAENRTYHQNVYLTERICGICSYAHTTCYIQAVDELLDRSKEPVSFEPSWLRWRGSKTTIYG